MAISTWDKNEIQVDIEIGVNASTDEKAQQMMDEINVTDKQGGKEISFKTEIGNMGNGKKNRDGGDQRRFYVDYKMSCLPEIRSAWKTVSGKSISADFIGPGEPDQ